MKLLSAETEDSPWLVFVAMEAVDVLVVVGVVVVALIFHYNNYDNHIVSCYLASTFLFSKELLVKKPNNTNINEKP
jgi:hypothetical protein